MAKDEKARDGAPTEDELERRRKEREAAAGSDPLADDGNGGSSIEDRAKDGVTTEEEDDGQYAFVTPDDAKRITFGTFIPKGVPVEYRITMGSKSNVLRNQAGGKGGLLDPTDPNILCLVRGVISEGNVKFTRDEDEKIVKAIIYLTIAPKVVINAKTEQAQVMMHGEPPTSAAS